MACCIFFLCLDIHHEVALAVQDQDTWVVQTARAPRPAVFRPTASRPFTDSVSYPSGLVTIKS